MVMFVLEIKVSKEDQLPHFYKLGHLTIHFPSALKHFGEVVLCWTCQGVLASCAAGAAWSIQKLKSTPCHCSFTCF